MKHQVNSDIFRQIIARDNRNNLDIFGKLTHGILNDGMQQVACTLAEGIEDWDYRFILVPDNTEFILNPKVRYTARAIYMSNYLSELLGPYFGKELPEKRPEEVGPCDLSLIDLAGWCKLIRFRFFSEENRDCFLPDGNKQEILSFMGLVSDINVLRNEISHENESTIRKYQNPKYAKKALSDLVRKTERSAEAVRGHLRNGEQVAQVLTELAAKIRVFGDMFRLSINRCPIDKKSEDLYPVEYLYGFDRILIAYPGCRSRNIYRFVTGELNPLMIRGRSNLSADTGTVEYLSELGMSADERQAEEAKRLFKAFDNDLKDTLSLLRLPEADFVPVHYTERLFRQLKETKETVCLITDDDYLCRAVKELPETIVAVTVEEGIYVSPYREAAKKPEEERGESRPAPAKVVIPARRSMVYYGDPLNGLQYMLGELIGTGGEGNIYRTAIGRECFKIYHEDRLSRKRQEKITRMLAYSEQMDKQRICWPIEAVYEASSRHMLVGYSMPDAEALAASGTKTLEEVVLSFQTGEGEAWNWDRKDLLNVCMDILELLSSLHRLDIFVGDLNPKNILVDREGEVFFIDTDSYQFEDFLCPVGIPEYTSPALWMQDCVYSENRRTPEDESFALGRLLYYILFLGDTPYAFRDNRIDMSALRDSIIQRRFKYGSSEPEDDYIWLNLSSQMKALFRRTFYSKKNEPQNYPTDTEWLNALYEMSNQVKAGTLSDELRPSDAILEEGDVWKEKSCRKCGGAFKTAHHAEEELCPFCRALRDYNRTLILRVRCAECGALFSTNPWELVEEEKVKNTREIRCPDCKREDAKELPEPEALADILVRIAENYSRSVPEEGFRME